jgi:tRNA A-37 threonylcarbamoyl transferase component Bud32
MNNQAGMPTRFNLTAQSLSPPPGVNSVPAGVLSKLKKLEGKGFPTEETFLAEVATIISAEELKRFKGELVNRADVVPQLILYFSAGSSPELLETRFYHAQFAPWGRRSVRGKDEGAHAGSASFQWSPALKVLAAYLLSCAASGRRSSGDLCPPLMGERSSPAASLNYAMSKKPGWIKDMFGEDSNSHPYLLDLISRTNPDLKRVGPVILCLNSQMLPPERISVYVGDRQVDGVEKIEQMACAIEKSFKSSGVKKAQFELTITGELETDLTPDMLRAIKERLAELEIKNSEIISVKKGSIKLLLELPPDEAERLFWAVQSGELDDLGVIGGEHVPSPPIASDVEDGGPGLVVTPRAGQEQQVSVPEMSKIGGHWLASRPITELALSHRGSPEGSLGISAHFSTSLVTVLGRFEEAWNGPVPPRIEDYLPPPDTPHYMALLGELVQIDLERRLAAGERLRVEEAYLPRFPELGANGAMAVSLIGREFRLRRQQEPELSLSEYLERWPQYYSELRPLRETVGTPTFPAASSKSPDDLTPASGSRLGCYELLDELGRGGMGIVYKARHLSLNRVVALKMVQDSRCLHPENLVRFLSEAEAVAGVQHPYIAQIYDVGQIDGRPYFTMEFVEGGTLAQKIARAPQPPRQAAHMVEMLARAVQAAHRCGIIHRDLKPANVLLAADGTPRITDFGLAKRMQGDSGLTHTGEILGSPSYMAPEQADGRIQDLGPCTDVYALGAILYELLTGRPPFIGVTVLDVLDQVKNKEPLPFSRLRLHVPRDLETICLKCLQKDPRQRYASAEDLADDLRRFLDGRPIVARSIGLLASAWLWCSRPERVTEAGVYAVALGVVLIIYSALGIIVHTSNVHSVERPGEAILFLGGLMGLLYLPMILSGIGTIARRLVCLWLGEASFSFGVIFSLGMILQNRLGFDFDFGGVQNTFEIRFMTCSLIGIIYLVGMLLHAVALLAYYSNRELMRGSRVDGGPSLESDRSMEAW